MRARRRAEAALHPGPSSSLLCRPYLLFGNETKLLQNAQIIVPLPLLDYLAVLDAMDGDAFDLHLPPSGGPNSSTSPW